MEEPGDDTGGRGRTEPKGMSKECVRERGICDTNHRIFKGENTHTPEHLSTLVVMLKVVKINTEVSPILQQKLPII